jgi:hypothetical protein
MPEKFYCDKCDYTCYKKSNWDKHIETLKHSGERKVSKKLAICDLCDYTCCKQSLMDKHKMTNKHKLKVIEMSSSTIPAANEPKLLLSSENGNISKFPNLLPTDYMSVISQLLNQNNELKNFIIEQATEHKNFVIEQANEHKKETVEIVNKVIEQTNKVIENVKPTNNTINGNVNNNQKFNINLFLNEQCKDAMNFSDFIKNIEVSREDLENNAQLGFVNGVSKILIESLKQLDRTERPIHCTDLKRETMYIKDEDKWSKEEDSSKLNKAIQEVTRKSMGTLMNWKEENPDYKDRDSEFSNRCIVIQQQSMAAHNRDTYYPKVIKAVAKEVVIDK